MKWSKNYKKIFLLSIQISISYFLALLVLSSHYEIGDLWVLVLKKKFIEGIF